MGEIMHHKSQGPVMPIVDPVPGEVNLIFRTRMLWRDLATWLRAYLISAFAGFGNYEAVSQRLYRLPLEYGNVLRVFFGDQATEQYITFVSNYIITMQSLMVAQLNHDVNAVNLLTQRAYANVNERAAFLASINPFWSESIWNSLLYSFTSMNLEQSTAMLSKDYARDIEIFDRILSLTTVMGDYFSEGLINYLTYSREK